MSELLTFQPPQFIVKATAKPPSEASLDGSSAGKQAVMREVQRKLKDTDDQDDGEAEAVEKAGHKYISRERKGNRWVYTYPDDATQAAPATPRAEAAEHTAEQKKAEYAFARDSAVQNKGEDLLGSARHKRNRWKGLEAAEADGSAGEQVNRKTLIEAAGLDLKSAISDEEPLTAVFCHLLLARYPEKPDYSHDPDTHKATRFHYVDTFEEIVEAIKGFGPTVSPQDAQAKIRDIVRDKINSLRFGAFANATADFSDQLARMYNRNLRGGGAKTTATGAILHIESAMGPKREYKREPVDPTDPGKGSRFAHVEVEPGKSNEEKKAVAEAIIDGKSVDKALGTFKQKTKKEDHAPKPAELYIGRAERIGPAVADTATRAAQEQLLIDKMGMRGVQFGNSVTDDERAHHLRETALAFHDLATATGLPEEMASFNGKLGIAIGARGHGTALAHYEPSTKVINLTRKNGVGSLAHEWGHFFDNVLGSLTGSGKFLTDSARFAGSRGHFGNDAREDMAPSQQMLAAMAQVFNNPAMQSFQRRLRDEPDWYKMSPKQREYWGSTIEVWARTFETYVGHKLNQKGQKNTYLAGVKPHPYWPNPEEMAAIAPDIDAVFAHFKGSEYLHKAMQWMAQANPAADVLGEFLSKGNKPLGAAFSHARKVAKENGGGKKKQKQVANRYLNSHGDKPIGKSTTLERGMEACDILDNYLSKAGKTGEGSRGGKIVGHTKSGKPIYGESKAAKVNPNARHTMESDDHPQYKDLTGHYGPHEVLGHTQSKKAVYSPSYAAGGEDSESFYHPVKDKATEAHHAKTVAHLHPRYTRQDHDDAAATHAKIANHYADHSTSSIVHRNIAIAHYNASSKAKKAMLDDNDFAKSDYSAYDVLGAYLAKGGTGEGSRGGKIIGHLPNGKPIYQSKSASHAAYSQMQANDHSMASLMHTGAAIESHDLETIKGHLKRAQSHQEKAHDMRASGMKYSKKGVDGGTASGKDIFSNDSSKYKKLTHADPNTSTYEQRVQAHKDNAKHVEAAYPKYTKQDHMDAARHHEDANAHGVAGAHFAAGGYYDGKKSQRADNDFAKSDYSASDVLGAYLAKGELSKSRGAEHNNNGYSGAGSRGGKVIGRSPSGRPIYESKDATHAHYSDHSVRDHVSAGMKHEGRAKDIRESGEGNETDAKHHDNMAAGHYAHADKNSSGAALGFTERAALARFKTRNSAKKSMYSADFGDNEQTFADTQNSNPDMLLVRPVDDVQHSALNDAIAASWPGRPFMASAADAFCQMDRLNRMGM